MRTSNLYDAYLRVLFFSLYITLITHTKIEKFDEMHSEFNPRRDDPHRMLDLQRMFKGAIKLLKPNDQRTHVAFNTKFSNGVLLDRHFNDVPKTGIINGNKFRLLLAIFLHFKSKIFSNLHQVEFNNKFYLSYIKIGLKF